MSPFLMLSLAALLGGQLLGCAGDTSLVPKDIRPVHHSTGRLSLERVEGIRRALDESPEAPVRVLAVHGMITNAAGYSASLQERLAQRLNLQLGTRTQPIPLTRGYDFVPAYGAQPFSGVAKLPPSSLIRTAWTSSDSSGQPQERLIVYELLWSPLRDQVKDSFVGCFERGGVGSTAPCRPYSEALGNSDSRFLVNRSLKEAITLGGFADATLVLGPIGDIIRDDITLALCVVGSDFLSPTSEAFQASAGARCNLAERARLAGGDIAAAQALQRSKFFAVTHSLGSFLFMDAQHALTAAEANIQATACSRAGPSCDEQIQSALLFQMTDQATVFMNANQVSLLSLARLSSAACSPVSGSVCPNPFLRDRNAGKEPWMGDRGFPRMTVFVALNDTNDLLGFELPPFMGDIDGNRFVNVSVRNPAFSIPGLFKHPGGAHTNQADNPAVIEVIVEGFEIPR